MNCCHGNKFWCAWNDDKTILHHGKVQTNCLKVELNDDREVVNETRVDRHVSTGLPNMAIFDTKEELKTKMDTIKPGVFYIRDLFINDKKPQNSDLKADLQVWMMSKKITFKSDDTKQKLLEIINAN